MAGYSPTYIKSIETGLVQDRVEHILPADAYPILQNAYVYRERIVRKKGADLVGRLKREVTIAAFASLNLLTGLEATSSLVPGSINIVDAGAITWTDPTMDGVLTASAGPNGTINYATGVITGPALNISGTFEYYPGLPVMGICTREKNETNDEQTVYFDTVYAYRLVNLTTGFVEFIPGFTWSGTDYNFFWSTNYWVTPLNFKLFWVTNFSGITGDPIRYSAFDQDTTVWIDFAPQIDSAGNRLQQCLAMVPFRGRLVTFRTLEGATLGTSVENFQRIRWAAIGNPIADTSTLFPLAANVNANAWRDDIRGQGGFLDIPTSQAIIAIGFVRDNLVVYCESSTWQLRYTGRTIAPFQIERVNSELGTESTFSAVQFDTSLVGVGDKGIVQCDSYKSERIDIKIPDLVFSFKNIENATKRIYGIRDFRNKLAYWIYPSVWDAANTDESSPSVIYPNRRLLYNYENDSWAVFNDSLTALGTLQLEDSQTWEESTDPWQDSIFPWVGYPGLFPFISGGNQQGFVFKLDINTTNDPSLYIKNITGNDPSVTTLEIPSHNLESGYVIKLSGIFSTDPFFDLNDIAFEVNVLDEDNVEIYEFSDATLNFTAAQIHAAGTYLGGGYVSVLDNFIIQSKKFNYLEDGKTVQFGFLDILLNTTDLGAITLNVYADYNTANPTNTLPYNKNINTQLPDGFFNSVIPTTVTVNRGSTKTWQRVVCPTRASFITIEYTLSPEQMNGNEQQSDVQIYSQILWMRPAGKNLPIGI